MATQRIQVIRASDLGPNMSLTPGNKVDARTLAKQATVSGRVALIDTDNQIIPSENWEGTGYQPTLKVSLRKLDLSDVIVTKGGGDIPGWNRLTIKAGTIMGNVEQILPASAYNFNAMDGFPGGPTYNTLLGFSHVIEDDRLGAQFDHLLSEFPYMQFRTYSDAGVAMLPSATRYPVKELFISSVLGVALLNPALLTYSLSDEGLFFHMADAPVEITLKQDTHIDVPSNSSPVMVNFADWDNPTQGELDADQAVMGQNLYSNLMAESGTGVAGDPFILDRPVMAELLIAFMNEIIPNAPSV